MPESCPLRTCSGEVALPGQFCSAEHYSEWLATRMYEALDGQGDPFARHQVPVVVQLQDDEEPPAPLIMQPWYHTHIGESR